MPYIIKYGGNSSQNTNDRFKINSRVISHMLDNNTIYMKNKRYFVLCLLIVLRYFIKLKILSGRGGGTVGLSVRLARGRFGVRIRATTAAMRIDAVFRLFLVDTSINRKNIR